MEYKNKTYIAFDGDNDIIYYYLMLAWKHNKNDFFKDFNFFDAHEINYARDESKEESIKKQLLTRLNNSNKFLLLIGEKTRYLYKFVRWEIEQAIRLQIPIICVNLNGKRSFDSDYCPSILTDILACHISFNQKILEHALEYWPATHQSLYSQKKTGPYYYDETTYKNLGL
ncbi:TIR domain-containing protein [Leptospira yanagawae]|uniref:TIR domain-containing protein n=1 Tax=Leptospira yanagawae TaxID=293069 RepID=UPI00058756CA|nr:TIR domain-containing protein [Leptospira yanagawae]